MTISKEQFTERFFRALSVNSDTLGTAQALEPYMTAEIAETAEETVQTEEGEE